MESGYHICRARGDTVWVTRILDGADPGLVARYPAAVPREWADGVLRSV